MAGAALTTSLAHAGTGGGVLNNGTINWSVNFRFPPTEADLTNFRNQASQASQIIWDATEGQLRYGTVTISCGARNEDAADMWIFPQEDRAGLTIYNDGSNMRRAGYHVTLFLPSSDSIVMAHEMSHQAFGLLDEYDEQPRDIGPCIEAANLTEQSHCLMQQSGGVSNTEFCVPMNHDPNQGEGLPCTPGAAPNAGDCQFYDPMTMRYEATQQTQGSGHSCWSRLVQNFPFLTAPMGLPAAAAPAGFTAPTFVERCNAATAVMLVLDRSGSMAWHPNDDRGEVCGNGYDDDGDGSIDETTTAGGCAGPRIDYLRAAARGYVALANGRAQKVGVVSFNDLAVQDVPLQAVDGTTSVAYNTAITNLMPGGGTAIGRALSSTATLLAAEPDATKTVFLISDGQNTVGEAPETVVPSLTAQGIRVFTISMGDASNDPTLSGIASMTRGAPLDSKDARTLVNAFVQQFARANNDGTLMPLFPYAVNAKGKPETKQDKNPTIRSPETWSLGKDQAPQPAELTRSTNRFSFPVEDGTERITIALAGDLDDMSGFGVRAELDGPAGAGPSHFDTGVPSPEMKVTEDGFFRLIEIKAPNAGDWTLTVQGEATAAQVQTGHVTVVTENPMVDLFTSLDRYVIDDVNKPVSLRVVPSFLNDLRDPEELSATLELPDGSIKPLTILATPAGSSGVAYEAMIDQMPLAGTYEVRVYLRTGPNTSNDPGESIYQNAPPSSVKVPILVRTAVETFTVKGKVFACPGGQKDCDGDCLPESKTTDSDGDGIPDDYDHDSDNDEIPDSVENRQCEPVDTDDDGTPDYLDTDSDGDGVIDTIDNCRLVRNEDQADKDSDGHGDACDNCPEAKNVDQADKDSDGQGDACDADSNGTGGAGGGGAGGSGGTGAKDCNCSTPGQGTTEPFAWIFLAALPLGAGLRAARRRGRRSLT
jgi:uncharacterized protein YegL